MSLLSRLLGRPRLLGLPRTDPRVRAAARAAAETLERRVLFSIPADLTGLSASAVSGTQVDLQWTDSAGDQTGFVVQQSSNGGVTFGPGTTTSQTGAGTQTFHVGGLSPQQDYQWRVYATNGSGDSASPTNTASASTLGPVFLRSYNFDDGDTAGWTGGSVQTLAAGGAKGADAYRQGTLTLTLGDLPKHTQLVVSFDVYALDKWDGNLGPSKFTFAVDGRTIKDTTFANDYYSSSTTFHQSYPDPYAGAGSPAHAARTGGGTGADLDNDHSDAIGCSSGINVGDSVYHFDVPVEHVADTATLDFSATGLPSGAYLGIDNVTVSTLVPAPCSCTCTAGSNNLFDGTAGTVASGVSSGGFGSFFGSAVTVTSNVLSALGGAAGNGSLDQDLPSLTQAGVDAVVAADGTSTRWFDSDGRPPPPSPPGSVGPPRSPTTPPATSTPSPTRPGLAPSTSTSAPTGFPPSGASSPASPTPPPTPPRPPPTPSAS